MSESSSSWAHALSGGDGHEKGGGALLPKGVAVLGAGLFGLGVVFWVAANWQHWGRMQHFALLQSAWLALCAAAAWRPASRTPLSVAAFLVLGGLLAFFGQTYQTGADPWTLFAYWAALSLPLCLVARRDGLWAAWALVVITAVSLWQQTWQGSAWQILNRQVMYLAWALVVVLCLALHPWSARWTGSGRWAHRAALLTGLLMMGVGLVMALLNRDWVPPWAVAALCLAVLTACTLTFDRAPDLVALSAEALMGNVLILGALAHLLFDDGRGYGEVVGELLLLGLVAAGLLAASVTAILRVARRAEPPAERPSREGAR